MTAEVPQTKDPAELTAKQYLARLIESSPDAVISTDADGNVTLFSARAEALRRDVPLFVDVWAGWCHTCMSMKEFVLRDPAHRDLVQQARELPRAAGSGCGSGVAGVGQELAPVRAWFEQLLEQAADRLLVVERCAALHPRCAQ